MQVCKLGIFLHLWLLLHQQVKVMARIVFLQLWLIFSVVEHLATVMHALIILHLVPLIPFT